MNKLGKLQKVALRDVWEHEAHSFTQWLALEENLAALGNEIGLALTLVQTEASVGGFKLDVLAEEDGTGKKVIVENQLEITNHDHLGKLLTYASGVDASYIVWIFKDIRPEHRSAIDWLNEHTDEDVNIFAIQMELWQIGDSLPAPKFRIVSSPNEWSKMARTDTEKSSLSETKLYQHEFWNRFRNYMENVIGTSFSMRKTNPQHWYDVTIGTGMPCHISLTAVVKNQEVGCELYIPDNKDLYNFLDERRKEIETKMGYSLEWMPLPDRKACRIKSYEIFPLL